MSIDCLPSGATPNRQPMASVVRFGEKDPGTVWAGQPLAKNAMPTWNPKTAYFSSGEKGLILGADDLSLLFQDSAGTTPVTAVEQPVGLVLDPSGNGANAYQATSTKRPVLRARYNLLTYSEQFDNAAWAKSGGSIIGQTTDPLGGETADVFKENTSTTAHGVSKNFTYTNGVCTQEFCAKAISGETRVEFAWTFVASTIFCIVDLANGNIIAAAGSYTIYPTVTHLGNGWYRIKASVLAASGIANFRYSTCHSNTLNQVHVGTESEYAFWGADLRQGTTIENYQRIAADSDYDSDITKFPWCLETDGIDDSLLTAAIDFSGTDKMTVIAGIRKDSDAALAVACELSATTASNNGSFGLQAPDGAAATYLFQSEGTSLTDAQAAGVAAPITSVVTGVGSIAADSTIIRVNGVQIDADTGDQGAGNYGNHTMYFGARAGTSAFFKGRIHYIIVRGAETPTVDLEPGEAYVNERTGAY